jgi:hypothetical protein
MENSGLREAAPTAVNVTVGQRSREYLTDREVERLIEAAKQNSMCRRPASRARATSDSTTCQLMSRQMRRARRRGLVSHSARLLVPEEPHLP